MSNQKYVLVVGASSVVGTEIVNRFRQGSYKVVATFYRNDRVAFESDVAAVPLDLTASKSVESFASRLAGLVPRLDVVVLLASILPGKSLADYDFQEMDRVIQVNFTGQAKLIKGILPLLESGSQILMISSISAQKGSYDPIYAASKGAVLSFVKSLATHLAPQIRVNAVAPSLTEGTAMFRNMSPERRQAHRAQTPLGRFLTSREVAEVIYDLSQVHWSYLNGACIDLNGGRYVR